CREARRGQGREICLQDGREPPHSAPPTPRSRSRQPLGGSTRTMLSKLLRIPASAGSPNSHSTIAALLSPARGPPVEKFSTPASTGVDGGASSQGVSAWYNACAALASGLPLGRGTDRAL